MRPALLALTGAFLWAERDPVSALSFRHHKADRVRRPQDDGAGLLRLAGRKSSSASVEASRASSTTTLYGQQTTEDNQASTVQVSLWKHVPASPSMAATQPSSMAARSSAYVSGSSYKEHSDRGGGGTPLARFNNLVNYERYGDSDDQGLVASTLEINSKDIENEGAPGPASASPFPLVVNFMHLMGMAFKSATSLEMQKKRRDLVRQVKLHGGYCVVEMDQDDVEARILDNMWDLMGGVLDPTRSDDESAECSPHALRRQVLKRNFDNNSTRAASDNPGYDFVQTTLVENSIRPQWIEERHGPQAARHAQKAYMLLAQLCKAFATIVYAGSVGTTPENATRLIQSLLDDPYRSFSGSYHRWCRYVPLRPPPPQASTPEKSGWGESLRPHVDWTISTAIPASAVAGLEVYDPSLSNATTHHEAPRRWVRVEEVVRDYWKRKPSPAAADEGVTTPKCRWNAHYVVVFAGAWLELLTEGDVEATLHRVVSRRDASPTDLRLQSTTSPRLSAPFFMRPKELVFQTMDEVFDDPSREDVALLDANEAVREMSQFLRESELLRTEGTTANSQ